MANRKSDNSKPLHELIEQDLQHLVDIIEQKNIVHEPIQLGEVTHKNKTCSLDEISQRLQSRSNEMGAESLAEYLYEVAHAAENADFDKARELLGSIREEVNGIRNILDED